MLLSTQNYFKTGDINFLRLVGAGLWGLSAFLDDQSTRKTLMEQDRNVENGMPRTVWEGYPKLHHSETVLDYDKTWPIRLATDIFGLSATLIFPEFGAALSS